MSRKPLPEAEKISILHVFLALYNTENAKERGVQVQKKLMRGHEQLDCLDKPRAQ